VSKLTTDVVTYCTEASNQKSKYAYRKILFYKKSTDGKSRNKGSDSQRETRDCFFCKRPGHLKKGLSWLER